MDISQQLKKRYAAGFDRGIVPPSPVKLHLIHDHLPSFEVAGTFYVGPDARAWVWFEQVLPAWLQFFSQVPPGGFRVQGIFDDGRMLLIEKAYMTYHDFNIDQCFSGFSNEGTIHRRGPIRMCFTALAHSSAIVRGEQKMTSDTLQIKYTLINAIFWGTEMISIEGTTKTYRGRFTVSFGQRVWDFVRFSGFTKELEMDLKNGLVDIIPTATAGVSVVNAHEVNMADKEIDALCRLISLVSDAATTWVVRQLWSGNTLVEELFASRSVTTDAANKSRYDIISNICPADGLKLFLESSIKSFLTLEDSLRLHEVVDYLEQARHQKVLQVQIAIVVLGLELLSHAWCLRDGLSEQQLSSMNIERKLGRMRRSFRFIEKGFTNDILRRDIRNPLIHSGQIPLLSQSQLTSWVDDLYLLTLRLLFCLLGYKGKYRDFSNGFSMTDAPTIETF